MDFKYSWNENVDWVDIDQDGSHCAFVKQAAGRGSYAQCNNSGTFIHACLIVCKIIRRRGGGRRRKGRGRRWEGEEEEEEKEEVEEGGGEEEEAETEEYWI